MKPAGARVALAAFAAVITLSGCGDSNGKKPDGFAEIPKRTIKAPPNQTAPRWQRIRAFGRSGDATESVAVSGRAIQWRARWSCRSGRFSVTLTPPPSAGRRGAKGPCPGRGKATWATAGPQQLRVQASDRWRLIVEEELRTPLHEPPTAAIRSARALATGRFYPIEIKGQGTASLYRLRNGRMALRIERFETEPNPSLVVWLSQANNPTTTKRAFSAPHTEIATLKSTIGDQNYVLPGGLDPRQIRSIVIWNKPSRIAYTAATLNP